MTQNTSSDSNETDSKNSGTVDKIRGLLFGEQQAEYEQRFMELEASFLRSNKQTAQTERTINEINIRLESEQRIRDTADILPDSMYVAADANERLADSMSKPMEGCIRTVIRKDPDQFADALFPVMGPAIRKSINETLKSFLQSMNQVIEQSMSPEALRWRLEAKRCGVPFSEIVLKQTLLYRVDEVFLIQQGSGLVIDYVSHPNVKPRDSDAISAMLTVIKDFSRDSFSGEPGDTLATVEFGERTLWIFEGPKALLACVILGVAPTSTRERFQTVLEQAHREFSAELEGFDGNRGKLAPVSNLLENCLVEQARENKHPAEAKRFFSKPITYVLLGVLFFSIYLLWQFFAERHRIDSLSNELNDMPGIVVFDSHQTDGKLVVDGMVDPLVLPLADIVVKHGFEADEVDFNFSLFQSLEPELAIKRAKKLLQPPDSVQFTAKENQLVATGEASQEWIEYSHALKQRLPGFTDMDLSGVSLDAEARLRQIQKILVPPDSIKLRLNGDILAISGSAPWAWIHRLPKAKQSLPNINHFEVAQQDGLEADEWLRALEIIERLNDSQLFFEDGTNLESESSVKISALVKELIKLQKLSVLLGSKIEMHLTGYTDGTGETGKNKSLALARSETVKNLLLASGLSSDHISTEGTQNLSVDGNFDQTLRRVDVVVTASKPKSILTD